MSLSTDTDVSLARDCEGSEIEAPRADTASVAEYPALTGTIERAANDESFELDEFIRGFARVPTEILDVASGLCVQESTRLLSGSSESRHEPHASNSDSQRYASIAALAKFIPACDPYDKAARTCRVRMSRRKVMLGVQTLLAFLVFLLNVAWTAWARKTHPTSIVIGTLLTGDCSRIKNFNLGLHLLLNAFSSLFLGAGNYCMQVLVAPTSQEVRKAHDSGTYFDIGIHSIHNFWQITRYRKTAWLGLGICSTLLHLIWNSAVFTSIPFVSLPVVGVTNDFLTMSDDWAGRRLDLPTTDSQNDSTIYALQKNARNFTRYSNLECMALYIDPREASSEVVLVANTTASHNNGSSLLFGFISGSDHAQWDTATAWVCPNQGLKVARWCTMDWARDIQDHWTVYQAYTTPEGQRQDVMINVEYCLVGEQATRTEMANRCELLYNEGILIMVCVLTLAETLLILGVLIFHHESTLVHVGDAIGDAMENGSSFDRQSSGHLSLTSGRWERVTVERSKWSSHIRPRWYQAVTRKSWIISLTLFSAGTFAGFGLFGAGVVAYHDDGMPASLPALLKDGIGKINGRTLIGGPFIPRTNPHGIAHVGHVLFANIFQVLVSFEYLFYNNILTCQVVGDEFLRFFTERKALRVSSPTNAMQRSSYFLSLPWKYAGPQMLAFVVLHWLVSQSVFTVQTTCYGPGPGGKRIPSGDASRVGFSVLGILITTLLGILMVWLLALNSLRQYPNAPHDFPRMAVNSAAIHANCRKPAEDHDAHLCPLRLGVVQRDVSLLSGCEGRVTFSTDAGIEKPVSGAWYEMASLVALDRSDSIGGRGVWPKLQHVWRLGRLKTRRARD